ncbi:hypothetical protein PCC7424_5688 (plasmid) [Gloeothece citriformis PCC 7424]|uniref:Uncharacterized protein n=1 Tax=Gloeothece citriformis (strain PCC 7424) TaxID=65393 RepID=B7KLT3_GLOC7|nr:hypothetical protein PCC7424_5688 [Gloeothece citriformis PCC 7424]
MVEELHPIEFCAYWVPKIYGISPKTRGKQGYRQACIELLSFVSKSSKKTCAGWIDYPNETNRRHAPNKYLCMYLRMVDVELRRLELTPEPISSFITDLRSHSEILNDTSD